MAVVIGLAGYSNSGKTTLVTKLVRHFVGKGLRTGVIKHDGHGHYKEVEGADSTLFIEAGADAAMVVSPDAYRVYRRQALLEWEQMLSQLPLQELDLVLVEGFKGGAHDQIAIFRHADQASLLNQLYKPPIAAVAPVELWEYAEALEIPCFEPDDINSLAGLIQERYRLFI
ncbi:molybdopterin-guanine dinucleotide biosynthesis protein B [Paenibacillus rigui]|uniref:Molybdopterin-guanine dinucleotide biosynthesis protein B n=1 Tax=Paenibacillus rigui TaxID=554312 RepID=A0A229ULF1_9BACL|nr:molybdopterin-guanine dinucleotide biosynthesis protein B [Paenibacillus rigui]OXM84114.1 molybdopterin-guanine dinucleotide biosynthesis protein B [Paenibacillus rigui]